MILLNLSFKTAVNGTYLTTKILKRQSAIPYPSRYQLNTVISRHVYDHSERQTKKRNDSSSQCKLSDFCVVHEYVEAKKKRWGGGGVLAFRGDSNWSVRQAFVHMQILQTDLYTFPLRISWENKIKDRGIFSLVIIFLILITLSLDNVWILLGEIVGHYWDLKG